MVHDLLDYSEVIQNINLLKSKTYFMYHQLEHSESLCSVHSAFMRFALISEQTATISVYSVSISVLKPRQGVFTARYELGL